MPDFSTLCRRQKTLNVAIPYRGGTGPLHLLIDATGIKAEGEGEWNAHKHGGSKKRLWRKLHLGLDEETLEIRAVGVTSSNVGDAPMLPDLLEQIPPDQEIATVTADGAYDTRRCHNVIGRSRSRSHHPSPEECAALEANDDRCHRAKRSREGLQISRTCLVAKVDRVSPPKPRRNEDALRQTSWPRPHGRSPLCLNQWRINGSPSTVRSLNSKSGSRCSTATPSLAYPSLSP